ncbi:hypothetical protein K437DRAFT_223477 [Tilletiaria anomala UBC 951]|uniref:WD40 repeat-like protein n=1 Tax=Tilletiaria anomala (strain ATCC 24038 / CBS 436.72 / UBC 951) TaxID=1037660 RepID=A0A066W6D0_TILAU|nr:uncharacterized protein K437DRAFT_223477 [Tilletiaria anomala UBC 951]KDN46644.1 hypothetical protein K437DRAFT_223477 [Tilletiaria anomala UBC 951]
MVLHIDTGSAWQLQWRPLAYRDLEQPPPSNEILGVLAAACMNGKLCFFQVPHPNELRHVKKSKSAAPLQIALKPILSLDLFETVPHCLDWAFPERILVGCSNGYAAVWDLEELLSGNGQQQAPLHYFRTQETAITGVRWHMHPNTDARGRPAWNEMPNLFTSCSLMGSIALTDLTDPYHQADIRFGGVPAYDLAFSTHANAAIIEGNLYGVDLFFFTNPHFGRKARVAEHRAPTLAIATSDYHPLLATGSADGSVRMVNIWRNLSKRGAKASVQLFRLTCGTESSELRVLDYFLPDILVGKKRLCYAGAHALTASNPHRIPGTSFDWPPEVAITDVAWSRHINRGYLLASVSASGLGRIQWVGEAPHKER